MKFEDTFEVSKLEVVVMHTENRNIYRSRSRKGIIIPFCGRIGSSFYYAQNRFSSVFVKGLLKPKNLWFFKVMIF